MRVTPVSKSMMQHQRDESDEGKRARLLVLLKELSFTDPRIAKLNRSIASHGDIDRKICEKILLELNGNKDRRSQRVVQIVRRILGCKNVSN